MEETDLWTSSEQCDWCYNNRCNQMPWKHTERTAWLPRVITETFMEIVTIAEVLKLSWSSLSEAGRELQQTAPCHCSTQALRYLTVSSVLSSVPDSFSAHSYCSLPIVFAKPGMPIPKCPGPSPLWSLPRDLFNFVSWRNARWYTWVVQRWGKTGYSSVRAHTTHAKELLIRAHLLLFPKTSQENAVPS